jgi:hypothetical protein
MRIPTALALSNAAAGTEQMYQLPAELVATDTAVCCVATCTTADALY